MAKPKNSQLFGAFTNVAFLRKPELERNKALDDILKANRTDANSFRKAITDNGPFWGTVLNGFLEVPPPDTMITKVASVAFTTKLEDYLKSDDFLALGDNPHNFSTIYQFAAQRRVSLGLKAASDEILVKILENNPDIVRAYLASKDPGIVRIFGDLTMASAWVANEAAANPPANPPAPARNTSQNVLTNEAITAIQAEARHELILRTINNQAKDIALLRAFEKANNLPNTAANALTLQAAIQALNLPAPLHNIAPGFIKLDAEAEQALKVRKQNVAKEAFKVWVSQLTDAEVPVAAVGNLLLAPNADVFRGHLVRFIGDDNSADFDIDDIPWAKGLLGLRYFESVLPKIASSRLDAALQATDNAVFRTELRSILAPASYPIEEVATPENQSTLKKAILQSKIHGLDNINELNSLENAVDLARFKQAVTPLGVRPNDWIENKHLGDLKQSARSRLLEIYVGNYSNLGIDGHPHLFKVFAGLSIEKQRDILSKPAELRHILNAKTDQSIKKLWGTGVDTAALIVENQRVHAFNQIHNSVVAKILASNSRISLNDNQIQQINNALKPPPIQPNTFTNAGAYNTWVSGLKNLCPGADEHFHSAFGLQAGGFKFNHPDAVQTLISQQIARNADLQVAYDDQAKARYQPLIKVFLGIFKTATDTIDVDDIVSRFKDSTSASEFTSELIRSGNYSPAFQNQLTNELTPEIFHKVKNNLRKINFATNAKIPNAIEEMRSKLEPLQGIREAIEDSANQLRFINKMQYPASLYYPVLNSVKNKTEAAEMQAKYKAIASDVELMINELRRSARLLQSYLDTLPDQNAAGTPSSVNKLRNDLFSELHKTDSDLEYCQIIYGKLTGPDGLINVAEDAAQGKKKYVYQANMDYRTCLPDQVRALPNAPAPANNVVVQGGAQNKKFDLREKIPVGQVGEYNVKIGNLSGQFIEQPTSPIVSATSRETIKTVPSKFTLKQFPTATPAPRTQPEILEQNRARVEFAMTMAIQVLASLEEPPSKEKPLQLEGDNVEALGYVWTALVLLGQNNPHMKFGPEAILVFSSSFNPLEQRDQGIMSSLSSMVGKFKFASDSIYNQCFTNHAAVTSLQNAERNLAEITTTKFDSQRAKDRKEVDKSATEVTESYRTKFDSVRQRAKKNIEDEGPAPVPPRSRN